MRNRYILIAVTLVALAFGVGRLSAAVGTLDSPDVPANTQSFTLEDIYNRLDTGAGDGPSAFTEPAAEPGTGTMHDLNDIMDEAPAADNTDGAVPGEVLTGKTYWSLRTDGSGGSNWGLETGELHGGCTCCSTCTLYENRWCDNGDGTVTDLTTCLVWVQNASWGGQKPWEDCAVHDDAHTRASSYGGKYDDWRLPTLTELDGLVNGTPDLRCPSPEPCDLYAFTGVQSLHYWSSTTVEGLTWYMDLSDGSVGGGVKDSTYYVWPVRGGQ